MDRVGLGLRIRARRIRAALRQSDLALAAGVPRRTIGELENGTFAHVSVDQLVRVGASLRATVDVRIRWHGEDLDRLIDAAHAATVAAVLERLRAWKWEALVEVSFAIWGERGSIDALAWHAPSRSLLVIEVKSVLPDLQATLRDLDRKTRLGPAIARERAGGPSMSVDFSSSPSLRRLEAESGARTECCVLHCRIGEPRFAVGSRRRTGRSPGCCSCRMRGTRPLGSRYGVANAFIVENGVERAGAAH
jgi:transcriptional regulator with XRE-family HTH domain